MAKRAAPAIPAAVWRFDITEIKVVQWGDNKKL